MPKTVFCIKLKKISESLDKAPFPGNLGEKILNHVSKEAWGNWIKQQTILINEYRLNMSDAKSRNFLIKKIEEHFFDQ